ncbi:MAG: hypothetical protein U1A27_00255 [Phycisphaerae bacterium]
MKKQDCDPRPLWQRSREACDEHLATSPIVLGEHGSLVIRLRELIERMYRQGFDEGFKQGWYHGWAEDGGAEEQ